MSEIYELINEIRSKKGKMVLFIGAGISKNVGNYPSWDQLVSKMNYALTKKRKKKFSYEEKMIIPEKLYNINEEKYYKILLDSFKNSDSKKSVFSELFMKIKPDHIITTNYDKLIEYDDSFLKDYYKIIAKDKDFCNNYQNHYLLKIHGDILEKETIVLKEKDYLDYSDNHKLIETFVKSLLIDHCFVFCGYSANDYNVKMMINWYGNLNPSGENFAYLLSTDSSEEIKKDIDYFKRKGIKLVDLYNCPTVDIDLANEKGKKVYSMLYFIGRNNLDYQYFSTAYLEKLNKDISQIEIIDVKTLLNYLDFSYMIRGSTLMLRYRNEYKVICKMLDTNNDIKKSLSHARLSMVNCADCYHVKENFNKEDYLCKTIDYVSDEIDHDYFKFAIFNDYLAFSLNVRNSCASVFAYNELRRWMIFDGCHDVVQEVNDFQRLVREWNRTIINYDSDAREQMISLKKDILEYIDANKLYGFFKYFIDIRDYTLQCNDYLHKLLDIKEVNSKGRFIQNSFEFIEMQRLVYDLYRLSHVYGISTYSGNLNKIYYNYFEAICIAESYKVSMYDIDIVCKNLQHKQVKQLLKRYKVDKLAFTDGIDFDFLLSNLLKSYYEAPVEITKHDILLNLVLLSEHSNSHISIKKVVDFLNLHICLFDSFGESLVSLVNNHSCCEINCPELVFTLLGNKNIYNSILDKIDIKDFKKFVKKTIGKSSSAYTISNQIAERISVFDFDDRTLFKDIYIYYDFIINTDFGYEIKRFIKKHTNDIDDILLSYFVYEGIIDFSQNMLEKLVKQVKDLGENELSGIKTYRDKKEKLINLIIFYSIERKIVDYSIIENISSQSVFLSFLFDNCNFDWGLIDLKDYRWYLIFKNLVTDLQIKNHIDDLSKKINEHSNNMNEIESYIYYKFMYVLR